MRGMLPSPSTLRKYDTAIAGDTHGIFTDWRPRCSGASFTDPTPAPVPRWPWARLVALKAVKAEEGPS